MNIYGNLVIRPGYRKWCLLRPGEYIPESGYSPSTASKVLQLLINGHLVNYWKTKALIDYQGHILSHVYWLCLFCELFSEPDPRIHQLEKDLYYYKKNSRDLKKKLREISGKDGVTDSHASLQSDVPSEADIVVATDIKSHERKDSKAAGDGALPKVFTLFMIKT